MSNTEKVNTSAEAVEARIAWLESNSYFGIVGTTDHHAELAVVLRALLRERDEARAHYNDVLAENDALRFERNNLAASLATTRADALREAAAAMAMREMAVDDRAKLAKLIEDFYAPWGAWKTVWWEGEVGNCKPFGPDNLLHEIAARLSRALTPPAHITAAIRERGTEDKI